VRKRERDDELSLRPPNSPSSSKDPGLSNDIIYHSKTARSTYLHLLSSLLLYQYFSNLRRPLPLLFLHASLFPTPSSSSPARALIPALFPLSSTTITKLRQIHRPHPFSSVLIFELISSFSTSRVGHPLFSRTTTFKSFLLLRSQKP